MNETERRNLACIARYDARLMNNAKWRRVLEAAIDCHMPVQFAFVREERFHPPQRLPAGACGQNALADCTAHGPVYYREIFAIRCAMWQIKRHPVTGAARADGGRFDRFVAQLKKIGRLPLTEDDDGIILFGYQKSV